MRWFSSNDPMELALERTYVHLMSGVMGGDREARKWVKVALRKCKDEAKRNPLSRLPSRFGDHLLASPERYPECSGYFSAVRSEGATDDDIRQWCNLHDLERRMIEECDEFFRLASFIEGIKRTGNAEAAAAHCRKLHPFFGDPRDTEHTQGDDRPLPYELKDRVNRWIERTNEVELRRLIEGSSTYNAVLRNEIRAGRL